MVMEMEMEMEMVMMVMAKHSCRPQLAPPQSNTNN
jgi:hypothetical protein